MKGSNVGSSTCMCSSGSPSICDKGIVAYTDSCCDKVVAEVAVVAYVMREQYL